jgi:hypothetical protein
LIWGGGLQPIERIFAIVVETQYADIQSNHEILSTSISPFSSSAEEHSTVYDGLRWNEMNCLTIHRLIEIILEDPWNRRYSQIWEFYAAFYCLYNHYITKQTMTLSERQQVGREIFYRSIQYCSWSKSVWISCFGPLLPCFSSSSISEKEDDKEQELLKIFEMIEKKGVNLRWSAE